MGEKEYPFRCMLSLKPLIEYLGKIASISNRVPCQIDGLQEMLKSAPELYSPIEDMTLLKRHRDLIERLMGLVFSPALWETETIGAVIPFSMKPFFVSPQFERLLIEEDGSFKGRLNLDEESFNRCRVIRAYLFILEKIYGIQKRLDYPIIRIVSDPDTGLDRYFNMKLDFRFVDVTTPNGARTVSDKDRVMILQHLTEPDVIREILPPEEFELHGFTIIQAIDVTQSEVLSALERDLIDKESIASQGGFVRLQQRLRTLFRRSDLVATLTAIQEEQILLLNTGCEMTRSCIFSDSRHVSLLDFEGTSHERAVTSKEVVLVSDILEEHSEKGAEKDLSEMGVRSLLIAPLIFQDECIGTLTLGSPGAGDLDPVDALIVRQVQPIFAMALMRALDDLENRVQGVIKEKCTALHPTVEWKFRGAAIAHLENVRTGQSTEMNPIVFKDVYPLYGVSDVRGSTAERNRAIQKDLTEHLKLSLNVVQLASEARPLLILKELAGRTRDRLQGIRARLGTGDEVSTVRFLREDVEPIFSDVRGFGPKVTRAIKTYETTVDPVLGTVYRRRKEFEESISLLSNKLAAYLDQEEAEAQSVFPHFFERHRTDGVDYLIYLGASLMEHGGYSDLYLKNMRLWQLKVTCGLAWLTEQLKSSLHIPLDTAHLILIQDTPLSIRFRFDEKRFDVDGAYNTRHEIIKSRIDKAVIKGKGERLTQPGKIAVVYSHPEEEEEMRRHIDFLRFEGYLTNEVEPLELEDLPGVQGLRSLRVSVDLKSGTLLKQSERMAI